MTAAHDVAAGKRLEVCHLTKRFGAVNAIDDLSFVVEPGQVTGFLGPNGAGKTTTLRCMLGLIEPTKGTATIGGEPYRNLVAPLQTVGAVLESSSFHPGRTARNHLLVLCAAAGIEDARADEVLAMTGMADAADRRVGGFSTGMRPRLGLAAALLGVPAVLVLDEPASGLDPMGITWLRQLLRYLALEWGKTVLVSSHLLAEMEQTADQIVIIAEGHLVREGTLSELIDKAATSVRVRTPRTAELLTVLEEAGLAATLTGEAIVVTGADTSKVGHLAFVNHIELGELTAVRSDLEEVFLDLTRADGQPEAVRT
jgi:ABC-2 type transport system ATP-binding protein